MDQSRSAGSQAAALLRPASKAISPWRAERRCFDWRNMSAATIKEPPVSTPSGRYCSNGRHPVCGRSPFASPRWTMCRRRRCLAQERYRIVAQEPSTWAVVTRRGRPTEQAIERAETAIKDTIARTQWFATGSATVRIHTPTSVLPFAGSFEVAVPVFCPCSGPVDRRLHRVAWCRTRTYQPSCQPTKPIGSLIGRPGIGGGVTRLRELGLACVAR